MDLKWISIILQRSIICHSNAFVKSFLSCIAVLLRSPDQDFVAAFGIKFKNGFVAKGEALSIYHALEEARIRGYTEIHMCNDSFGVVDHCGGITKRKTLNRSKALAGFLQVHALVKKMNVDGISVQFHKMPSNENKTADAIASWAYKDTIIKKR